MTELYLIRHGETLWNKQGCLQGHLDSPLTEKGEADALKLLDYFSDIPLSALYSSDLGRAQHSIAPLAKQHQLPVVRCEYLREISYDFLDGKAKTQLTTQDKQQLETLFSGKLGVRIGQGESLLALQQRIYSRLTEIVSQHPQQSVAVMSHGLSIVMFLKAVLHIPVDAPRAFNIHNGSVTHLSFEQGKWMLQSLQR